jgi:hypothetical protein
MQQWPWPDVSPDVYIDPTCDLHGLSATALFYPCSGADLWTPITLFAPLVAQLHFADVGYFRAGHQNTRTFGLDTPVEEAAPIAAPSGQWAFAERKILPRIRGWRSEDARALQEQYRLTDSGRSFDVIRSNAHCEDALEQPERPLGVFFYRGDSLGEGGSGILWNGFVLFETILDRLVDGGLFVTDGSNPDALARDGFAEAHPILSARYMKEDKGWRHMLGRTFRPYGGSVLTCVGFAGFRYGATLIWQLRRDKQH